MKYVLLTGKEGHECPYQISLQKYESSYLHISEGFTHRFRLEYSEKTHFVYYHNRDVSFKIMEFMESGDSSIHVTPIDEGKAKRGLSKLIDSLKPEDYQYHGE